ncbi:hypothetical protein V6N11_062675 [Hibiscus sabdariffa]|uniref:EF-hand domain-containing protein n=1 Tax=Hibiscus sabdariffa TaxID=183260 RepID=A0ABR2PTC4_9ROSI
MFFDKDGSGYIELDELRDALTDESRETDVNALNDIMREVDTNKASRQYSRERFKILSINLMKDGSLQLHDAVTSQAIDV